MLTSHRLAHSSGMAIASSTESPSCTRTANNDATIMASDTDPSERKDRASVVLVQDLLDANHGITGDRRTCRRALRREVRAEGVGKRGIGDDRRATHVALLASIDGVGLDEPRRASDGAAVL